MAFAEPVPASIQPFGVGRAIGYGWRKTWKNFWRLLLVVIVYFAINLVVSLLTGFGQLNNVDLTNPSPDVLNQLWTGGNIALAIVSNVISILITFFLTLGIVRIAIGVTNGQPVRVGTVFQFAGFGRYLGASIVVGILVTIGMLIGLVPFFIIWNATNSVIWLAVGLIVGVAIAIVLNLGFSFYSYLIIDRNAPGLSSLGESWRMVMPHFWPLFGLQILLALIVIGLFFAAIILGILLIIIGLLVTMPIWAVISFGMPTIAFANAYKAIAGEPIAK